MALPAFDLLGEVEATLATTYSRGLHRPGIHDTRARVRVPAKAAPQAPALLGVQAFPSAIDAPPPEPVVDGQITNDKSRFARGSRLKLRPKRRGRPTQDGARRAGIDEIQPDRWTLDRADTARRRVQAYLHLLD